MFWILIIKLCRSVVKLWKLSFPLILFSKWFVRYHILVELKFWLLTCKWIHRTTKIKTSCFFWLDISDYYYYYEWEDIKLLWSRCVHLKLSKKTLKSHKIRYRIRPLIKQFNNLDVYWCHVTRLVAIVKLFYLYQFPWNNFFQKLFFSKSFF